MLLKGMMLDILTRSRAAIGVVLLAIAFGGGMLFQAVPLALALPLETPEESEHNSVKQITELTTYYLHPQPARIPDAIRNIGVWHRTTKDPLSFAIGFFAAVFEQHPEKTTEWLKARAPGDEIAEIVLLNALWLAGLPRETVSAMQALGWSQDRIASMSQRLTRIPELGAYRVATGADQDMFWGAFYASGDEKYVLKVLECYVETANSGIKAEDIAAVAAGISDPTRRTNLRESLQQYSNTARLQAGIAAAALWSLGSNAAQHRRVHQILARYVHQHEYEVVTRTLARQVAMGGPKAVRESSKGRVELILMMTQDPTFRETQVPLFFSGGKPVVPERIFNRGQPIFVVIIMATFSRTKAQINASFVDPTERIIHMDPQTFPSWETKEESAIGTVLIRLELNNRSSPGLYRTEITVRPTQGPMIVSEMSFLVEEEGRALAQVRDMVPGAGIEPAREFPPTGF